MNNITDILLGNHSKVEIEEWLKKGGSLEFNSGKSQQIVKTSITALEMQVSYSGLTFEQFSSLRSVYEQNHANTVIIDASDAHDIRGGAIGLEASTWAFVEFKFGIASPNSFSGSIKLISSVFFDYPNYQEAFSQSSNYIPSPSSDFSFFNLIANVTPYQVDYEYLSNSIFSSINQSVRHIKEKGGLKKKWRLHWSIDESGFLELQKYYRKKAGIMGTFGIVAEGVQGINGSETLINARFEQDSFKFTKQIGNVYQCNADIVEVL